MEEAFQKTNNAYYQRIKQVYLESKQVILDHINRFFRRFADENNITYEEAIRVLTKGELDAFKMTLNEYFDYAIANEGKFDNAIAKELEQASIRVRVSRLAALQTEIDAELAKLDVRVNDIAYEGLATIYRDQYSRNGFEIFRATGVGVNFAIPPKDTIDTIVRQPWGTQGQAFNQKHGGYSKYLRDTLSQSMARICATGEGYKVAVDAVANAFGGDHKGAIYKAKRLVYTEMSYFSEQAQFDSYKELGVEYYQFNTELTTNVCPECQALDQKIFKVKDGMTGVNKAPMHPNCRCYSTSYYEEDKYLPGYIPIRRSGRNDQGKSVEFPEGYSIQDWEKNIEKNKGTWTMEERMKYRVPEKLTK